jgi:multidrug efflux pump subunit AcrB
LFERSRNGYIRSVALAALRGDRDAHVRRSAGSRLGLISTRPTGLVPPEDQGYVLALVNLPAAAALERTNAAMSALTRIARDVPGVDGVVC